MAPILSSLRQQNIADIIFEIKPIIHTIYSDYKSIHCDYCIEYSQTLKKCSKCKQMYYCGKDCQTNDWIYHKIECKVMANEKFKFNETDPTERLLIRLWLTIKSDESFVSKRYPLIDGKDISFNDIQIDIEELSKNKDLNNQFELISKHFKSYGLVFDRKELLRLFGVIKCSSIQNHFIWYPSQDLWFDHQFRRRIGCGLYLQLSSVSHSCAPNSAIVTKGLSLQLRVMKPISAGKDITRSYVYLSQISSKRHKILWNNFLTDFHDCRKSYNSDVIKFNELFDYLPIDRKHLSVFIEQILSMGSKVFGKYHPDVTTRLVMLIEKSIVERKLGSIPYKLDLELYRKLETNIRITYGSDHPFYEILFDNCFQLNYK